jgi:serine/threonine protein kinase
MPDHLLSILDAFILRIFSRLQIRFSKLFVTAFARYLRLSSQTNSRVLTTRSDILTDIYAAGVVLYEMTTGRLPFEARMRADLTVAVLSNRVTLLSAIRPDCPPELERIILKAMSRDRSGRFQNVSKNEGAFVDGDWSSNGPRKLDKRGIGDRLCEPK